jgi:hypothetical protein
MQCIFAVAIFLDPVGWNDLGIAEQDNALTNEVLSELKSGFVLLSTECLTVDS